MNIQRRLSILQEIREIARDSSLDIITIRKHLGEPLAARMRHWLSSQPDFTLLCFDFTGVRAVTLSVAEEIGPLLMQTIQQSSPLEHKYPIYRVDSPEPVYTFATAFANSSLNVLALVKEIEPSGYIYPIVDEDNETVVVLGQMSRQTELILEFADREFKTNQHFTSDSLTSLDFMSDEKVKPAARSKRLTELHARRLLAFEENPNNPKERLFVPAWRI